MNTVKEQYADCSKYMGPELKAKFNIQNKKSIDFWMNRKVDQYFVKSTPDPIEKITKSDGTYFVVKIPGTLRKYTQGIGIPATHEKFVFTIKTVPFQPNRPFLFELKDFYRITIEEEQRIKEHERLMKDK